MTKNCRSLKGKFSWKIFNQLSDPDPIWPKDMILAQFSPESGHLKQVGGTMS